MNENHVPTKIVFKNDGYYLITCTFDEYKPKDYIKKFNKIVNSLLVESNSLKQDLPLILDKRVKGALIPCDYEKFAHVLLKPCFEKYSEDYN
jgi:hypothetical protein